MKKMTSGIALVALAALAGCFKNDSSVGTPRAGILLDLVSPNAINTNIILNGNVINNNISYGSVVPNYYNQVVPGPSNVTVTSSTNAELLNQNFNTVSGKYYSVFMVDSVSKLKAIIVTDSVNYPDAADSVKVRFYNFAPAPNAVPLTVRINDSINVMTSRTFETQQSAASLNTFQDLKAGTYLFQVFTPFNSTKSLKDTSITFDGKHIYTVFIKGFYPDSTGATAIGLGVVKHG